MKQGIGNKLPIDDIAGVFKLSVKDIENNKLEPEKIILTQKTHKVLGRGGQRILISEDLINLHKEITKEEDIRGIKNNLWG
ncbi:MAG: hypothetical protein ABI792_01985 [bacterium]